MGDVPERKVEGTRRLSRMALRIREARLARGRHEATRPCYLRLFGFLANHVRFLCVLFSMLTGSGSSTLCSPVCETKTSAVRAGMSEHSFILGNPLPHGR